MKKLLLFVIALLMVAPTSDARRKVKKAGTIQDGVFVDGKYGFELTVHQNWKAKIGKENDKVRIRLTQKNYDVPPDYMDAPDYTKIPMLVVYVDTTSFGEHTFIDSLTSEDYKSDQKKEIRKEFEILYEPEIVPKTRSRLELAGKGALLWRAQAKYMKEVLKSASSVSGKRVRRSYGGAIAAVKMGDNIILFHTMTEWEYFEPVMAEVMTMLKSLKFPDEDEG